MLSPEIPEHKVSMIGSQIPKNQLRSGLVHSAPCRRSQSKIITAQQALSNCNGKDNSREFFNNQVKFSPLSQTQQRENVSERTAEVGKSQSFFCWRKKKFRDYRRPQSSFISSQLCSPRSLTSGQLSLPTVHSPNQISFVPNGESQSSFMKCFEENSAPFPLLAPLSHLMDRSSLLYRRRSGRPLMTSAVTPQSPRAVIHRWTKRNAATWPPTMSGPKNDDVFLPSQPSKVDAIEGADEVGLSIVERMYFRAVKNFYSHDTNKIRQAQLMMFRLTQVGFKARPKAMSVPTIKVTVHTDQRCVSASETPNRAVAQSSDVGLPPGRPLEKSAKCLSKSESDFFADRGPNLSLLDSVVQMMLRRKDSVSLIQKRSSIPCNIQRQRRSSASVSSQNLSISDGRRSSLCGTLWSGQLPANALSPDGPLSPVWSNLLSCVSEDDRKNSFISRRHVSIPVPVCQIGKEKPLVFTSLDVIEKTLRRMFPEIVVKKCLSPQPGGEKLCESPVDSLPLLRSEFNKGSHTFSLNAAQAQDRRLSINTCISNMRMDQNDYDKQLTGVRNVGTFAEEETLKVLFAKSDAISCVIEAMKSFPEKEELQLNACTSLLKMASASEANCVHILANDGLNAIANTLRLHKDTVEIVRHLFSTIAYISTGLDPATTLVKGGLHLQVLSVMSQHSSDQLIVRECCYIIGNLLTSVETAQQLMYVGGVHTIISLVKQFPEDANILENVCRTLGSFAFYDETCLDVARAGATCTVLGILESSAANASVIECGCWALACLTACVQTAEELINLNGTNIILKVLREFPKEQSLQDYGIRVLCNLSDYDQSLPAICSKEVVSLLHIDLNHFQDCVELLEIISATLCQVIGGNDCLCSYFVEQKGIKDVVQVMLWYSDNGIIQENGCKIIGNVAVQEYSRKKAEMDGASKAVISAMLTNESNATVQEVGCLALMNLTADNKDNKVRIKNAGAVPTLLSTLREFSYNSNIVLCVLKVLGNLISLEEVCHLLLDERGLETIISLTKSYTSDEGILVFVSMILSAVAELPDLKEEEVRQIDETLAQILTSTQDNADVTLYVCEATENLMRTDVGRETFMKNNRFGVILSAMNSFPNDHEIHRTCCKVIAVVAFYMDSKRRLITETTVKTILKSMELFPHYAEIQIVACGTIACILEKIAILKHEVIGQGGIGVIKNAINNHPMEPRLGVVALMALGYILPIDHGTYPEETRVAYKTVIQCMNNFGENKEIQIAGCVALSHFKLSDKNDVMTMTSVILNTIRRHGDEPEIQKKAALALRPAYQKDAFPDIFGRVLSSPSVKVNEIFWQEFNSKVSSCLDT